MREQRIPTSAGLAATIALAIACKTPTQRVAMDYVHDCRPGASVYRCTALRPKANKLLPAGRLEGFVPLIGLVKGENMPDNVYVFVYMMNFEFGGADVLDVLRAQLGEPDGHGELPIDVKMPAMAPFDYWKTEDGYWISAQAYDSAKAVFWMSNPFSVDPKDEDEVLNRWDRGGIDRYVREAPQAAAIWDKLGRTLIGSVAAAK